MTTTLEPQSELFGTPTMAFDSETLQNILDQDNEQNGFINTKRYFLKYFAKSSTGSMYYRYEPPEDNENGEIVILSSINDIVDQFEPVKYFKKGDTRMSQFKLKDWFRTFKTDFYMGHDPHKSMFYKSDKTGRKYINLSPQFLHRERKPYKSFSKDIRNKVQCILDHMKKVWNSGNEEAYKYCLNWHACALTGKKMNTALLYFSGEGTGKSILMKWFVRHVIGEDLGLITQRGTDLQKFNSEIESIIYLVFEELSADSKGEWNKFGEFCKHIIDGDTIQIERKGIDKRQITNRISSVFNTNHKDSTKLGDAMRRWCLLDISHDHVDDVPYFKNLLTCLTREVGEAFFWYLVEHRESNPDFDEQSQIPMTKVKLAMKEN